MSDQLKEDALNFHRQPVPGKIAVVPTKKLDTQRDLALAYSPGVAYACLEIKDNPDEADSLTSRANLVAVISNGTAVLGLGNIGPLAGKPVMEGKGVLFKKFAGINVFDLEIDERDPEKFVNIVASLEPTFGGINLEDIRAPECFYIEKTLKEKMKIPVFHDDQHGTAIVTLAALINALKIVGKRIEDVRIVVSGVGAAGNAIIRLLLAQGAKDIVGYGRTGALAADQTEGMHPTRKALAEATNPRLVHGSLKDGLADADVFIGVSSGNILTPDDVATMADDAIVFALANPTPEVDPIGAAAHAAVVATGRSDYPNQINNVLAFPGLFRGLLDAKVKEITTEVLRVAAIAIASVISEDELSPSYIIPGAFDKRVAPAVSRAVRRAVRDLPTVAIPVQPDLLLG